MAKEVVEKIIDLLIGRQFLNFKVKRRDNVCSLATITSTVKIKDKIVVTEPTVLINACFSLKKIIMIWLTTSNTR